jgi:hypothetical protein
MLVDSLILARPFAASGRGEAPFSRTCLLIERNSPGNQNRMSQCIREDLIRSANSRPSHITENRLVGSRN